MQHSESDGAYLPHTKPSHTSCQPGYLLLHDHQSVDECAQKGSPAALNCSLNLSKDPRSRSMAARSWPSGAPATTRASPGAVVSICCAPSIACIRLQDLPPWHCNRGAPKQHFFCLPAGAAGSSVYSTAPPDTRTFWKHSVTQHLGG